MTSAQSLPSLLRLLPHRLPRLCVAVTGADPNEIVEKAEALVRDDSMLEFRLDYLSRPGLAIPRIKRFLEANVGTIVIATCRTATNGRQMQARATPKTTVAGGTDPFVSRFSSD